MGTRLQVVASMAVVGSVVGGGVALASVPNPQPTAATASQPEDTNGQTLQSLLQHSAALHAAIESARQALAEASAQASASPPPSVVPPASTGGPTELPNPQASSTPSVPSAPVTGGAPTTRYAGDDGRESGGHDDGADEGSGSGAGAGSSHTGEHQRAPGSSGAQPPGGGDD